MDNRQYIRANYHVDITLIIDDNLIHGVLDNISMGGLFANLYNPFSVKVDDMANITIPLPPGSEKDCIVVPGMVTRLDKNRMAFRFLETDFETLRIIFNLVRRLDNDL